MILLEFIPFQIIDNNQAQQLKGKLIGQIDLQIKVSSKLNTTEKMQLKVAYDKKLEEIDNAFKKLKDPLYDIVEQLILNIEQGTNRSTIGAHHEKIFILKNIETQINATGIMDPGEIRNDYLRDIMKVCEIKRHKFHFWATPHSVSEFHTFDMSCKTILGQA